MLSPTPGRLDPVQKTGLWTLHSRASFAERGLLDDPEALRLGAALGPELRRTFGRPDPAFADRARLLDARLRDWLREHPGATVVSLGEGLETQRHRVEGYGRWVSVDLPEVIDLRERFIAPTPRHLHLRGDAADLGWLDVLEPGACVIAQGLFMYLDPDAVRRILTSWWARSGPGDGARSALLFDVVPPWVSRLSRLRVPLTPRFRLPPMPWGARREALEPMLAEVLGEGAHVAFHPCPLPAGPIRVAGTTVVVEIRT